MEISLESKRGRFITVEGGEGVGKSTNIAFIEACLTGIGLSVVCTREPGGTPLAEEIRSLLISKRQEAVCEDTELLLMFAARAQHLQQVIQPALDKGQWVLCDRFTDATYAYQGGGRGMSQEKIAVLEQLVQQSLRPDLVLLLDLPVDVGIERASKRGALDRFESEKSDFYQRIRDCYLERAKMNKDCYKVINAASSLAEVQFEIRKIIDQFCQEVDYPKNLS